MANWTGAPPPSGLRLLALGLLWLAGHQDLLEAGKRGQALTILRSMSGDPVVDEFVENVLAGGLCLLHSGEHGRDGVSPHGCGAMTHLQRPRQRRGG